MDFARLLTFLTKLKKNNNKEWFDKNKKEYDELRKEWIEFTQQLIDGVTRFDPGIEGLQPKECIFRINRDIRFSANKAPYKTNFGAAINRGGKKTPFCGYYIHIEPGGCFIAGGAYMPEAPMLAAIRQEIDYNLKEFEGILNNKTFKKHFSKLGGDKLSRPPKGFEATNPAVEYLKHKSFIAEMKLDEKTLKDKNIAKTITDGFKALHPLVSFLNKSVE